ncbi:tRNA uridine-5-carboxymethylaminomethyl(34) synthesis GTPase MnmE [Candidatus Peregrinibacteria bacterium]|nr:tRNA uridine-5-carboxymethylaminomethyl(34) synthesis GTPase MnmE [Candidatus Peregrinibacteria bacterium]
MNDDTIVAISTPEGSSLKALIRLSGSDSFKITQTLKGLEIPHRLDLIKSPHTYTKEDIAEIQTIGSPHLVKLMVAKLVEAGARLAEPGEFTMRAFLNGRIDLLQAEAVLDVIKAQDDTQHRLALEQLGGAVSNKLKTIEDQLLNLCAEVEAAIDFTDQDIEIISVSAIASKVIGIETSLGELLKSASDNTRVDGELKLLIYGAANSGKSTLFNRLATNAEAITSDIEGTTRDIISGDLEIGGLKLKLLDSAGILESRNQLDKKAIQMTQSHLQSADLILLIMDITAKDKATALYDDVKGKEHLVVLNKTDLLEDKCKPQTLFGQIPISIAALYGKGIDELKEAIYRKISEPRRFYTGAITLNLRQKGSLDSAFGALESAYKAVQNNVSIELTSFDLRNALNFIGIVTGRLTTDDILKRIFERFCIGK